MRKNLKFLTVVISLLIVFAVFSSSAFAACSTAKLVQRTDTRIQQQIDTSVMVANNALTQQTTLCTSLAGLKCADSINRAFSSTIESTVSRLITTTDRMATQSADLAAKSGDTIVSDYVQVDIGGQTVLVDPIRIY